MGSVESVFQALIPVSSDKTSWHKGNHILPRCLTDNSPLNDLLLGVNYANDAQTNSSRGQLRQPLISGQFSSCFTDIQLKNCVRTSALSGAAVLARHGAEVGWYCATVWWGRAIDHGWDFLKKNFITRLKCYMWDFLFNLSHWRQWCWRHKRNKMLVSVKRGAQVNLCLTLHLFCLHSPRGILLWNLGKSLSVERSVEH